MTMRDWILNERDCWSEIGKESNSDRIEQIHVTVGFEVEITHALLSMSTDCSQRPRETGSPMSGIVGAQGTGNSSK